MLVALYSSASGSSLCPNMILHHLTFTSLKQLEVKTLAAAMLDHCWDNTVFVTQTRKAQAKRKPGTLVLDKIITISLKVQEKLLRSDRGHHSIKTKDLCPLRPQSGRSLLNMWKKNWMNGLNTKTSRRFFLIFVGKQQCITSPCL